MATCTYILKQTFLVSRPFHVYTKVCGVSPAIRQDNGHDFCKVHRKLYELFMGGDESAMPPIEEEWIPSYPEVTA